MKTGDSLQIKPGFDATLGMGGTGPMPAQVAYIHPRRRFYTVRFTAPAGAAGGRRSRAAPVGGTAERMGDGRENDCHI